MEIKNAWKWNHFCFDKNVPPWKNHQERRQRFYFVFQVYLFSDSKANWPLSVNVKLNVEIYFNKYLRKSLVFQIRVNMYSLDKIWWTSFVSEIFGMWPSCIILLRRKLKRGNDESLCWSLCRIGHLLEEEMPGNFVPNSMAKISLLSSKIPGSEMLWNSCWQVGSSAWKIVRNVMPSLYLGISSASSKSDSGSVLLVCRVVSKILEL